MTKLLGVCALFYNSCYSWFPQVMDQTRFPQEATNEDFYSWEKAAPFASQVSAAIGAKDEGAPCASRLFGKWVYSRHRRLKVAAWRCPAAAAEFHAEIPSLRQVRTIDAGSSLLVVSKGGAVHAVDSRHVKKVNRVLRSAGDETLSVVLVPLENALIAIGSSTLVFLAADCGRTRYGNEISRLKQLISSDLPGLFPAGKVVWKSPVDPSLFEELIWELLLNEPGVRWIRRAGPTREPDKGRDLIAEWTTAPQGDQSIGDARPIVVRRVVVQCKARAATVGKSQVTDIRDTVAHFEATGYFLAVLSQLSTGLVEHLERFRGAGELWVDWWTRSEIETRLRSSPDIAKRFSEIVLLAPPEGCL